MTFQLSFQSKTGLLDGIAEVASSGYSSTGTDPSYNSLSSYTANTPELFSRIPACGKKSWYFWKDIETYSKKITTSVSRSTQCSVPIEPLTAKSGILPPYPHLVHWLHMSSLRKDSHSMHNPTRSNGAEHSNRSSRRRLASHPGRWSTTGYEFSEPPVTVGVRSRISSDSTPSCASLPRQTHDHSRHFAVRTVSSYAGIPNDCSPIALSVITSVLGLNKEIRRLTKCICHQNEVVEDFQNALTMLANIQNREHERDWGYEVRCTYTNAKRTKRQL
ncbi:hypothetical protein Ahy_A04g020439 isoform C [Arachis hypogaea]|uniref:Uncharacterized protein n=1 Tax=Arachis hypogaea TaxID=3818 RepID=A0A445DHQ1_ARAHY|nr:hypothetical protein Ahy_A04g020439 isoform C [Arachis hypogaea]